MFKKTTDQKIEMQTEVKQPVVLNDDELDGVAGGPHYLTVDGVEYDSMGSTASGVVTR